MKLTPLLLSILGLLAACSSEQEVSSAPDTPATEAARTDSAAGNSIRSSAPKTAPMAPADSEPTTYQLLQGKWQSTEDSLSVIEIREHQYIDYYDGKRLGTAAFILDRTCPGASGAGHPGDNEKFLVEPEEDMCWAVVSVDAESLELSYTARGNSLNYRKLK
jgi:hypothetical protein